jgi:hypothetical protein
MQSPVHADSFERLFSPANTIRARTVEEILRLDPMRLAYDGSPGKNPGYLFRGELDYATPLQSSLERYVLAEVPQNQPISGKVLRDSELKLIQRFQSQGGVHIAATKDEAINRSKIPWNDTFRWLSLMQHYGEPTRLIDFSLDVRVALFFATWHHSNLHRSSPALASDDLVVYGFPCFGFSKIVQNKTPVICREPGEIDMNFALGRRIGLIRTLGVGHNELRPSPLRTFGWDRPFYKNERLDKQAGMFVYPFDDPPASLRGSRDSWLVANISADGSNDPFKTADSGKPLPGLRITLPADEVADISKALDQVHSVTKETLFLDVAVPMPTNDA